MSADPTQAASGPETLTYLFGVTRSDAQPPQPGLPGLPGGGPPRVVDAAPLRAIVCDLDRDTLTALGDPNPDGIATLAAAARAHDDVLAALARHAAVVPLRLGTVAPDDAAVRSLLARHATALTGELERFGGRSEWAVKVHLAASADGDPAEHRAAASGREYLRQRQTALRDREERRAARGQLAERLQARLAAAAEDADVVERRPVGDEPAAILHGVYLLDTDRQAAPFQALVDRLRGEHPEAVLELTGPFPPYHFTSVRLAPDEPSGSA